MSKTDDLDFEGADTLGKIYHSLTDQKTLVCFFLESALSILGASSGCFYLAGLEGRLWLESKTEGFPDPTENCLQQALKIFEIGKAVIENNVLYIPIVVSNGAMGLTAFLRSPSEAGFEERQLRLGVNLAHQAGSALKNILLFERTVEMEKLAAIGQSMGMVLHEIKNIVQLASFADEWLKRGLKTNNLTQIERGSHGISKALREMNGFVYEILSLTKNYKINPQPANLRTLLEELRVDLGEKAETLNIRLEIETDASLTAVECEERSIYRAILNLAKNAMEACSKPGSWVKVRATSLDEASYTLTVSDNGQGMSPEVRAKIRQAFFSTKGEHGTGLGVLIVEKMLLAHHGKMEITSEEGAGSTFTLTLPKKLKP